MPVVALPPAPLAPLKFSGLIDLVFASDSRKILPKFDSIPLNLDGCCANKLPDMHRQDTKSALLILAYLSLF
jgi:hypothetical protein